MDCRICGCEVGDEGVVACGRCGVPFHRDCWEFAGGCGIYGCGGKETGPWEIASPGSDALVIEEGTAPAFRVAPLVESLVRRLPRALRGVVPPTLFGGAVAGLAIGLGTLLLGRAPSHADVAGLLIAAVGAALATSWAAGLLRRRPLAVGLPALAAATTSFYVGFGTVDPVRFPAVVAGLLTAVIVFAAFGDAVAGRGRQGRWGGLRVLVSGLVTVLLTFLWFLLIEGSYAGAAVLEPVRLLEILTVALTGFAACGPSFALSSSALMHRLKAEAAREE